MTTRAETVLDRARAAGVRIAVAESCTGGLLASAITEIAGASDVFECGFVTYSNAAKRSLLGVAAETLAAHGAVSPETAAEMAQGALHRADVTLAVSVTGIAGPGGSEHKPEGRVCFGVARPDQAVQTRTMDLGALGRTEVRRASVEFALDLLVTALSETRR